MEAGSVLLNSPVDAIDQHGDAVIVYTANGTVIQCRKAILALPTNMYSGIRFSPPLPHKKRALVSTTKSGTYAKVVLTYRTRWWKQAGLVGKFSSMIGPICFSWEIADDSTEHYSLALFISGRAAEKWHQLNSLAREEAVISHLARLVGPEHAELALDVLEVNQMEWTKEDYIGTGPTSTMGPGQLSELGEALRSPFKNVHFAGGETAYEWKGYLEGALRSGSRASDEVTTLLSLESGSKL